MSNPNNPRLHPPYTIIEGINPDSPDYQQMEQIDQLNVFLLQDIDEKFSNFHQVITTRLIPAVKKFNAVSEPTREAAKFWRSFFEAAAAVRVPEPGYQQLDPSTPFADPNAPSPSASPHPSAESSFFADLPRGGTSSTPLNHNRYSEDQGTPEGSSSGFIMESPVERFSRLVQQDIEQDQSSSSMGTGPEYGVPPPGANAKDPRDEVDYDSDQDSPDASFVDGYDPNEEEAPTPQPQRHFHQSQQQELPIDNSADALANLTISPLGLPNFPVPTHSTTSAFGRASSSSQQPAATLANPRTQPTRPPSVSTPRAGRPSGAPLTPSNPFRSTPGQAAWNGLADLRSTPLTFSSKPVHHQSQSRQQGYHQPPPRREDSDSDSDEDNLWPKGMSPPRTMNFSMPPSAKKRDPERMVPVDVARAGGIGERVKERLLAGAGGGSSSGGLGAMPTPPRPGPKARGSGGRQFDIDDDEEEYEEEDSIGGGGGGGHHHQLESVPGSVASQQPYYHSQQQQQPPNSASSTDSYLQHQQPPNPSFSVSSSTGSHYSHAPQPTHEDDHNDDSSSSSSSGNSEEAEGDLSLSHLDHRPLQPPPPPPSLVLPQHQHLPLNLHEQPLATSSGYKAVPPQTELDESFYSEDEDGEEERYEHDGLAPQPHQGSYLGAPGGRRTSNLIDLDDPFAGGPSSGAGGARYGAGLNARGAYGQGGGAFLQGPGTRDEMLTFNGGRLEDAAPVDSPTPYGGARR